MEDKIIIPLHKHIAILYPSEIQKLLLADSELYIKAIRRGKSEKRYQANENRMNRCSQVKESFNQVKGYSHEFISD